MSVHFAITSLVLFVVVCRVVESTVTATDGEYNEDTSQIDINKISKRTCANGCMDDAQEQTLNRKRILMFPVPLTSHVSCFIDIAKELAQRGHDVDIAIPAYFQPRVSAAGRINYVRYQVSEEPMRANNEMLPRVIEAKGASMELLRGMTDRLQQFCYSLPVNNEQFFGHLKSIRYDLAIIDYMPPAKCVFLVPHRLGVPYVSVVDIFEPWIARTPWLPSWAPNFVLPYSDEMSFFQRLTNALIHIILYYIPIAKEVSQEIMDEYRKYGPIESMAELAANSELWLFVSDPLLGYPQPLMPNTIQVGGLSTKPAKVLPDELLARIAAFPKGFILVTFGSGSGNLTKHIAQTFIEVFSGFDLLVIWRFENPERLPLPKNILTMNWVPQNDLLGHEKAILFITHCGKNGLFEALYHGVPVVGFPLFGDQPFTGKVAETKRYGKILNLFSNQLKDDLKLAIQEVLDNPEYRSNIEKASRIFHDQRETPVERAVHWIEHIMKFGGGYLRSQAFKRYWYQYLMVDILLFLVAVLVIVIFILRKCMKLFCRRFNKTASS